MSIESLTHVIDTQASFLLIYRILLIIPEGFYLFKKKYLYTDEKYELQIA